MNDAPPSSLHDHTGYWLNRLRGEVHGSFEQALAGRGVTVAQWCVLIVLYHEAATTPAGVAAHLGIDTGAITRLLDRMVAKALLARTPDAVDRRSVRLVLTEAARRITPELAAIADRNDAAFFAPLTAAEHGQFRALLARLLQARGIDVPTLANRTGGV